MRDNMLALFPEVGAETKKEEAEEASRRKWDARFIKLAEHIATWSPCVRRAVGAVIVRDKHVLGTGYNGPPRGAPHRTDQTCVRSGIPSGTQMDKVCCAHAEANAVAQAAYHGVSVKGATLYVNLAPCAWCARTVINAGIVRVVYTEGYPDPAAAQVYEESNVKMEQFLSCIGCDLNTLRVHAASCSERARMQAALDRVVPPKKCGSCDGHGVTDPGYPDVTCSVCKGKGTV